MLISKHFTGTFFLVFLLFAGLFSLQAVYRMDTTESISIKSFIKGQWTNNYEKNFDKNLSIYEPSRHFMAFINYTFFKTGKSGVLIGQDNWLFTNEEFILYPNHKEQIKAKIQYIDQVQSFLKKRGIEMIVALIPSKARVYHDKTAPYVFPKYNQSTYHDVRKALQKNNISVSDILWLMNKKKDAFDVFLQTDTHWTTSGAKLSARAIYSEFEKNINQRISYEKVAYGSENSNETKYSGDLLEFIPLGPWIKNTSIHLDTLKNIKNTQEQVSSQGNISALSLFEDKQIPITLVGTSYSANSLWNFAEFLKEQFQTDILNAADEGQGPFTTMQSYLQDDAFKTNPPKLIIWEIPERYLAVTYDLLPPK